MSSLSIVVLCVFFFLTLGLGTGIVLKAPASEKREKKNDAHPYRDAMRSKTYAIGRRVFLDRGPRQNVIIINYPPPGLLTTWPTPKL